ncbi:MAG: basic amino acid ABC transporter substrate-binding protein [Actinomycetota bacterium]|nr:basic amino acid ABC transporter substrate-binding protein [Actinomycetota bacterium]MDD5666557.1 basic amino acid ABC transporter substrate-binding protein [Actinomycetota bacterium]
MSRKNLFVVLALMLALVLATMALVAGCGEDKEEPTPDENGEEVAIETIEEGKLLMGSDTTYPPFESIDDQGNPEGFDIDIAKEVAKRLGLELEVKSVKWEGIIPGLKTDDYDIVMSAMTITEERLLEIDFSDPYIDSNQSIAVQEENEDIKGEEDLAGKVVGVQVDTTGQFYAEGIGGIKEIRKYDTILLAFQDLELGRIDAIMNDFPVNAFISKSRGGTKVVATITTDEQYGIGIKKGNDELLDAVNGALADMMADGTYDEIFENWFGVAE